MMDGWRQTGVMLADANTELPYTLCKQVSASCLLKKSTKIHLNTHKNWREPSLSYWLACSLRCHAVCSRCNAFVWYDSTSERASANRLILRATHHVSFFSSFVQDTSHFVCSTTRQRFEPKLPSGCAHWASQPSLLHTLTTPSPRVTFAGSWPVHI